MYEQTLAILLRLHRRTTPVTAELTLPDIQSELHFHPTERCHSTKVYYNLGWMTKIHRGAPTVMQLAALHVTSLTSWQTSVTMMLDKLPGNPLLHKL